VWNPDVVVPPSELRCHGRWLMVKSLSDHAHLSSAIPLIGCDPSGLSSLANQKWMEFLRDILRNYSV